MERLPYIDEHTSDVPATAAATWAALLSVLRTDLGSNPPPAFARAMHLEPARGSGDWARPALGDALPGFEVVEVRDREALALSGRHRFSRYSLVFRLEEIGGGHGSRVRAQTRAEFPGALGRGYRTLVIGTRMHRLVVRRLLAKVAERA